VKVSQLAHGLFQVNTPVHAYDSKQHCIHQTQLSFVSFY